MVNHQHGKEECYIRQNLQSSQVKHTPQYSINEFIIRKLNSLVAVDFWFISAFMHV